MAMAALCAAQVATAAQAAELGGEREWSAQRRSAFAGARFRVPFGGREAGKARLGLTLAPVAHGRGQDGTLVTRYGRGIELALAGTDRVGLSLAGRPVSQLVGGGEAPDGRRLGVSPAGWAAIAVGAIAVSAAAVYVLCGSGTICNTEDQ
jgi:hypothetical protein